MRCSTHIPEREDPRCQRDTRAGGGGSSPHGLRISVLDHRMTRLSFDSQRDGVASAEAERGDSSMDVAANHLVDQRDQNAGTAGPDGMADGDGSPVYVDLFKG